MGFIVILHFQGHTCMRHTQTAVFVLKLTSGVNCKLWAHSTRLTSSNGGHSSPACVTIGHSCPARKMLGKPAVTLAYTIHRIEIKPHVYAYLQYHRKKAGLSTKQKQMRTQPSNRDGAKGRIACLGLGHIPLVLPFANISGQGLSSLWPGSTI